MVSLIAPDGTARFRPSSSTPPPPINGGTFYYCPWAERSGKGRVSLTRCAGPGIVSGYRGSRFRTQRKYRAHWRRYHSKDVS